ncbi:MAG: hypothetical protein ABIA93_07765 [Candidatus Woesearchaeota archaeon]
METGSVIYARLKKRLSTADLWNKPCGDFCPDCINCQFWAEVRSACRVKENLIVYEENSGEHHEIWN